jgi:hypothetical protein
MRAALCLVLLLSACAGLSESDCRVADWYALGLRDGDVYGMAPMIDQYTYRCAAYGVRADATEYMRGWRIGEQEYRARLDSGGSD